MLGFCMCVGGGGGSGRNGERYVLGLDFGTSGVRGGVIEVGTRKVVDVIEGRKVRWDGCGSVKEWEAGLREVVGGIPEGVRQKVVRVGVDGTSGTVVWNGGEDVKRYDYAEGKDIVREMTERWERFGGGVGRGGAALSSTSSLAKVVAWRRERGGGGSTKVKHQADVVTEWLLGRESSPAVTDWNNALKMGYDVVGEEWPAWVEDLVGKEMLMEVVRPGSVLGVADAIWGFEDSCQVVAGTTDSIAAFVASGGNDRGVGTACTSLGSTLALKLLSDVRVDRPEMGIYSHRYYLDDENGDDSGGGGGGAERTKRPLFLVGGASNVGGRTLRDLGFTSQMLRELSYRIDLTVPFRDGTELLYPLPPGTVGERFPLYDPDRRPELHLDGRFASPVTDNPKYLRAVFESIAEIERTGYEAFAHLGAPHPVHIFSSGGGAHNPTYTNIRAQRIQVPISKAEHVDACIGAALLAHP